MLINTPEEIEQPLIQSKLILKDEIENVIKGCGEKLTKSQLQEMDMPAVTLGKPEWWNLTDLVRKKGVELPAELSLQLQDAEFYLVRCACSFRSSKNTEVEWARLSVTLRSQHGRNHPTAFDIYPREIYQESQNDVKINIAPSLKFIGIELTPGEILATVHFTKLEPIIVGTGIQESELSWDFEKFNKKGVRGAKFLYMIIKRPHSSPAVQMSLDIIAIVKIGNWLFPAHVEGVRNRLIQTICNKD